VSGDGESALDRFGWSPAPPYVPMEPDEKDGWCVRDAFCALFGWTPSSAEWWRFREAPAGKDVPRLAEHLGLTLFDRPQDWDELFSHSAHPGIAWFVFPTLRKGHTLYVPDVRPLVYHWATLDGLPSRETDQYRLFSYGWPLGSQHLERGPELDAVIVDQRQAPRPWMT
jgi:hypothetical protein